MPVPVCVAVFPVAGLGTRFLPATKVMPKEMLPLVDRPLIDYAVEEAREAGIEEFVFVASRGKTAIEDHFDVYPELVETLKARGKTEELAMLARLEIAPGQLAMVRQHVPLGLGHAIWCARNIVRDRPFAIILPDDVVVGETGCLKQLVDAYARLGGNVVAVENVPREQTNRYGILDPGAETGRAVEVRGLVEKPYPAEAPSTLSVIGRYILQPEVFAELERHQRGAGGEIQLTDAMARLIGRQPFHGLRFAGRRFDCGSKLGFIAANVALGLKRKDFRDELVATLGELLAAAADQPASRARTRRKTQPSTGKVS